MLDQMLAVRFFLVVLSTMHVLLWEGGSPRIRGMTLHAYSGSAMVLVAYSGSALELIMYKGACQQCRRFKKGIRIQIDCFTIRFQGEQLNILTQHKN